MLIGRKNSLANIVELKEQNTKLKNIMRVLGSDKFRLQGAINSLSGAFDLKENDKIVTLDFMREQIINVSTYTVTIYNATVEQYKTLNEVITLNDYIILNLGTRKVMIRTISIKELMLVQDEILIVLNKEEA